MRLLNADGSQSEVSGNGVRCLGAWLASRAARVPGQAPIEIETEAGVKRLELLGIEADRYTFRAAMGPPEQVDARRRSMSTASRSRRSRCGSATRSAWSSAK